MGAVSNKGPQGGLFEKGFYSSKWILKWWLYQENSSWARNVSRVTGNWAGIWHKSGATKQSKLPFHLPSRWSQYVHNGFWVHLQLCFHGVKRCLTQRHGYVAFVNHEVRRNRRSMVKLGSCPYVRVSIVQHLTWLRLQFVFKWVFGDELTHLNCVIPVTLKANKADGHVTAKRTFACESATRPRLYWSTSFRLKWSNHNSLVIKIGNHF